MRRATEYANLIGDRQCEPEKENPMLGFRGASRHYDDRYRDGFGLECRAIRRVREEIGMSNVVIMIPFCRTREERDRVLEVLADNGLRRGENAEQARVARPKARVLGARGLSSKDEGAAG